MNTHTQPEPTQQKLFLAQCAAVYAWDADANLYSFPGLSCLVWLPTLLTPGPVRHSHTCKPAGFPLHPGSSPPAQALAAAAAAATEWAGWQSCRQQPQHQQRPSPLTPPRLPPGRLCWPRPACHDLQGQPHNGGNSHNSRRRRLCSAQSTCVVCAAEQSRRMKFER